MLLCNFLGGLGLGKVFGCLLCLSLESVVSAGLFFRRLRVSHLVHVLTDGLPIQILWYDRHVNLRAVFFGVLGLKIVLYVLEVVGGE